MSARDQLTAEQRATLAAQLGSALPARNSLLMSLGESIRERRGMGPVLRRLLDGEELLAHVSRFEIPRPGTALPLLLMRSYAGGDRWAICDREGRRWDRDHGWMYEGQHLDERTRTDTRFPLAEAWPLAHKIAAGENPVPAPHCDCYAAAGRIGSRGVATTMEHDPECNSVVARAADEASARATDEDRGASQ